VPFCVYIIIDVWNVEVVVGFVKFCKICKGQKNWKKHHHQQFIYILYDTL